VHGRKERNPLGNYLESVADNPDREGNNKTNANVHANILQEDDYEDCKELALVGVPPRLAGGEGR
jgi:hypothetical protein